MALRAPRRSFATPFVITLAAIPACTVSSAPPPQEPQPQVQPAPTQPAQPGPGSTIVENPPRPGTEPAQPGPSTGIHPTPMQPAPGSTTPATRDTIWYIAMQGTQCTASLRVECPKAEPGKPQITCNPPPPFAYPCPPNWDGKTQLTVAQYQGTTECWAKGPGPTCAPNEKCAQPPATKVPCPKR